MAKIRSGLRLIAVSAAVVLGLGSVSASGGGDTDETLRLHLGSHGTYFEYSNHGDPITQKIKRPKHCQITVNGPLATLSASDHGPGLKDGSIGVKSGGSKGTPCSLVDSTEDLTLSLGDVPDAVQVDLDLEFKGDVQIEIVLSRDGTSVGTFEVRSGWEIVPGEGVNGSTSIPYTATATAAEPIANCLVGSHSAPLHTSSSRKGGGPNSGAKNNCFVTILPSGPFDAVTFHPLRGEMSLEGGGDYGKGTAFDTLFTLAGYDGELGCEENNNSVTIEEDTVFGQITRLQNTDGSPCVLKPYNLDVDTEAETVSFVPHDNEGAPQPSAYQAMLKFAPDVAVNPLTSQLEYDQDDDGTAFDFEIMPWCTGDPFAGANGSIDTTVIPTGDTWCVVEANTAIVSPTETRTTWTVVGIGDPKFR